MTTVQRSITALARTFVRAFGRVEAADHRQRRLRNLIQSAVTNLGGRILTMAITFFSVPLTINYLGKEQYGAWVSIMSFMAWIAITDFGLGNGLSNAVVTAAGQDRPDLVRVHLSNGLVLMSAIAGGIAIVAAIAWPSIDWGKALGVQTPVASAEVAPAVAVMLAAFIVNMPLSMAGKVYQAYQQGRIGNYWGMAGNILGFVALLAVTRSHGGLVWLAAAVAIVPLILSVANNIFLFICRRPELRPHWRHADLTAMRQVGRVGGSFFLIQIMALVTFQTDNLLIGWYLGAAAVPEYNLTYSLFNYTALPLSILFSYMWTAYTEAIARKDVYWVSRAFQLHLWGGTLTSLVGSSLLVAIAKPFIGWWAGESVVPTTSLVWWTAAWAVINGFTNPIACFLAAASHLKMQTICAALSTVTNLCLSIFFVQRFGVTGVIAGTVIAYLVFTCVPIYLVSLRLIRKLHCELS